MSTESKLDELLTLGGVSIPAGSSVEITGADPVVDSPFRLGEAAAVTLAAQGAAIATLWQQRGGRPQRVTIDVAEAGASLTSVLYLRERGYAVPFPESDYPTTDFYKTKDGRSILTHGGYPLLRDRILNLLRVGNDRSQISKAIAEWDSEELEAAVASLGGCAVIARTREEWLEHPQGRALNKAPLVDIKRIGASPVEAPTPGPRPLSGLRVLDVTHVLAGPTASRVLAEQGADVLRISCPTRPVFTGFIMDTGHGKLSTMLDLTTPKDADRFRALLSETDVLLYSYRPGGLDRLGFTEEEILQIRPGIIFASVSCYGEMGEWHYRPGWEQLAQTATGMSMTQGSGGNPALSTVYPNDYVTGYVTAYGILSAVLKRASQGGSYRVKSSLCRTAMWLQSFPPPPAVPIPSKDERDKVAKAMIRKRDTAFGPLTFMGPVPHYSETAAAWDRPTTPLAYDPVAWPAGPRFSGAAPETEEEEQLYTHEMVQV